jgi:IS5 family transposase
VLDRTFLHGLDDTEVVLNWTRLEVLMGRRCASTTGRPSYPFLTLLSSLFLGIWYKILDEYLAASLTRDLLFRRFCRFKLSGDIPDATTLGCFANDLFNTICVRSEASTYADAPYSSKETRETLARFSVANLRATKRLGDLPLLVSYLGRNKEIVVTRSRAPVRHLQTAVWPGANTGYGAE